MARPRQLRPWIDRVTTVVWGLITVAIGAVALTRGSSYHVDLELVGIGALLALGLWLLVSGLASIVARDRER